MQALGNTVVIRQEGSGEHVSTTGIVLSTGTKEDSVTGVVIAVGPGRVLDNGTVVPLDVTVGDTVVFRSAQRANVQGEDILIVDGANVLIKL